MVSLGIGNSAERQLRRLAIARSMVHQKYRACPASIAVTWKRRRPAETVGRTSSIDLAICADYRLRLMYQLSRLAGPNDFQILRHRRSVQADILGQIFPLKYLDAYGRSR